MIAKLSGILDSVFSDSLILDVSGVGYQVYASPRTLSAAGQPGDALSLLIEMQVREDAMTLYGFSASSEQEWFRLLHSVQGVGPKAALAILGVCPPEKLGFAIAAGDAAAVRQADGVGPKLATRIITELKDKASKIDLGAQLSGKAKATGAGLSAGSAAPDAPAEPGLDNDAVSALINLGYGRADAYSAVMQARQKTNDNGDNAAGSLQGLIRLALKELAQ